MTLDENRQGELDHMWISSLLDETMNSESNLEQERLRNLFASQEFSRQETGFVVKSPIDTLFRWMPIAMAATIAVAIGCWSLFFTTDQRAYAAIARGMQPISVAREYSIRMVSNSAMGAELTNNARLFLDSEDRFVVHRLGWLQLGDVWFGKEGSNQWVVPKLGPAIVGSERILAGWMTKKDSTAPYLHIQTVLKRMEKGYTLTMLPDTDLDSFSGKVICERVRGERKDPATAQRNNERPSAIEMWTDKATGIVHRLDLTWDRSPTEIGPIHWTIVLQGYPTLAENWFKLIGHTVPGQRIVMIGKGSELDTFSKTTEDSHGEDQGR